MSEHDEACALVQWWDYQAPAWGYRPDDLVHIPNEGGKGINGEKRKREGVRAGIPDYLLTIPREMPAEPFHVPDRCAGLWIELKTKTGTVQKNQREQMARLDSRGYATAVCRGWEAALDEITRYLGR